MPHSVKVALQIGETKHEAVRVLMNRVNFIVKRAPQGRMVSGAGQQ